MTDNIPQLIGVSESIKQLQEELKQAGRSDAKVIITGESGVGKEVAARLIHRYSARQMRPFCAINCGGVPDSLLESELFGHVRGSFTGAYRDKPGIIEQAHGGTVFMDEVGEMSPRMQTMLLRFLENGEIQRVGADRRTGAVNVRVIAATNRVLLDRIAANQFREDLYYRLNVIHLVLAPLRSRREDIEPLLRYFIQKFCDQYRLAPPEISREALDALMNYDWPGNVRELKNVVERFIVRGRGDVILPQDLPSVNPAARSVSISPAPAAALGLPAGRPAGAGVSAELFDRIVNRGESFWSAVYEPFMTRDLTRADVRVVVTAGLQQTRGNYKMLVEFFNMAPQDYKRFLNFLRKHQCHMPFQQFRTSEMMRSEPESQLAGLV
jgi:transcriptional regulator with PAS, ATPase and Fis domain